MPVHVVPDWFLCFYPKEYLLQTCFKRVFRDLPMLRLLHCLPPPTIHTHTLTHINTEKVHFRLLLCMKCLYVIFKTYFALKGYKILCSKKAYNKDNGPWTEKECYNPCFLSCAEERLNNHTSYSIYLELLSFHGFFSWWTLKGCFKISLYFSILAHPRTVVQCITVSDTALGCKAWLLPVRNPQAKSLLSH